MLTLRKGFTLIEVAVVLVVLAILAAIAIPTFNAFMDGVDERAARASVDSAIENVRANSALDGQMYPLQTGSCEVEGVDNMEIWKQTLGFDPEFAGEYGENRSIYIQDADGCVGGVITNFSLAVQGSRANYEAVIDLMTGEVTSLTVQAPQP